MIPDEGLLNYVLDQSRGCRHITLIDPGKQSAEIATRRAIAAIEAGSKMIFVGGSTDTPDEVVHQTCKSIQESLLNCKFLLQVKTQIQMKRCGKYQ